MESLYFLNITGNENGLGKNLEIFAQLPGGKSTGPGEFNFFYTFFYKNNFIRTQASYLTKS